MKDLFNKITLQLAYRIEETSLMEALKEFNNVSYPELSKEESENLVTKLKEEVELLLSGKRVHSTTSFTKLEQYKLKVIADRSGVSSADALKKMVQGTNVIETDVRLV